MGSSATSPDALRVCTGHGGRLSRRPDDESDCVCCGDGNMFFRKTICHFYFFSHAPCSHVDERHAVVCGIDGSRRFRGNVDHGGQRAISMETVVTRRFPDIGVDRETSIFFPLCPGVAASRGSCGGGSRLPPLRLLLVSPLPLRIRYTAFYACTAACGACWKTDRCWNMKWIGARPVSVRASMSPAGPAAAF